MQIYITDEAVDWLIEEMDLEAEIKSGFFQNTEETVRFNKGSQSVWG